MSLKEEEDLLCSVAASLSNPGRQLWESSSQLLEEGAASNLQLQLLPPPEREEEIFQKR